MTDEFTRHLLAKRDPSAAAVAKYEAQCSADPVLAAARALIIERVAQLRPHGVAIVELLHTLAMHAERRRAPHEREATLFWLLITASRLLGVEDRVMAVNMGRINGADEADIQEVPSTFSFDETLGGDAEK